MSLDLIPGVPLAVSGKDSQERVVANMERLAEAGINVGVVVGGRRSRRRRHAGSAEPPIRRQEGERRV